MPNPAKEAVDVNLELKERLHNLSEVIIGVIQNNINESGLIPEYVINPKTNYFRQKEKPGFNSEMLGYAMRIAVENNNKTLFTDLHKGFLLLKEKGDYGLLRARLKNNLIVDNEEGTLESWAVGNQDVALALLEAGAKWDKLYKQQGLNLAKAFINSEHVEAINDKICVFDTNQQAYFGKRIRRIDLSTWNYRLYKMMRDIHHQDRRWGDLIDSGHEILKETLQAFILPPNNTPLINGSVVTWKIFLETLSRDETLTSSINIPVETLFENLSDPFTCYRLYGWDSVRIPYRLMDTEDENAQKMSFEIYKRVISTGELSVGIQAESGSIEKASVFTAAIAPLLTTAYAKENSITNLLRKLENITKSEIRDTPFYWKLWIGLGVSQLCRTIDLENENIKMEKLKEESSELKFTEE